MARRATRESGITLIEVVVASALLGVVVLGVLALQSQMDQMRKSLAAKHDAETQGHLLFERIAGYLRTRMTARADSGFRVGVCARPEPAASCLEIIRRRRQSGPDTSEIFRFKSACQRLTREERSSLSNHAMTLASIATSAKEACGFSCTEGQKPTIVMRHFPDERLPRRYKDYEWPAGGRLHEGGAATAGLCIQRRGADELSVVQVFTFLRRESAWTFKSIRKHAILTLSDDQSPVEWMP